MYQVSLKMISIVCVVHSQEFLCVFHFVSCKTSQNVNILQLLAWSKFKVSKQLTECYGCKAVKAFTLFFLISLDETTSQLSTSMKLLEKNLKGLKDKVCSSQQKNWFAFYRVRFTIFINIRVMRLRSRTDWKSQENPLELHVHRPAPECLKISFYYQRYTLGWVRRDRQFVNFMPMYIKIPHPCCNN